MVILFLNEINAGDTFTEGNVRSIRPRYGLHPKYLKEVIGKVAKEDLEKGTPLNKNSFN
jgi:pseudaminic acid synthase